MDNSISLELLHIDHGCKAILYQDDSMDNTMEVGHAVAKYAYHGASTTPPTKIEQWVVNFNVFGAQFHNIFQTSSLDGVKTFLKEVEAYLRTQNNSGLLSNVQVGPDKITFKNLAGHVVAEVDNIADFIGALQDTYGTNRDLKLLVVGHRDQKNANVYRPFREIRMRL